MSYIAILPKELQCILDHYVNHNHWRCLSELTRELSKIPLSFVLHIESKEKHLLNNFRKLLNDYVPTKYDKQKHMSLVYDVHFYLTTFTEQLITKDTLLNILHILCDNLPQKTLHKFSAQANKYLKHYGYIERIISVNYVDQTENLDKFYRTSGDYTGKITALYKLVTL